MAPMAWGRGWLLQLCLGAGRAVVVSAPGGAWDAGGGRSSNTRAWEHPGSCCDWGQSPWQPGQPRAKQPAGPGGTYTHQVWARWDPWGCPSPWAAFCSLLLVREHELSHACGGPQGPQLIVGWVGKRWMQMLDPLWQAGGRGFCRHGCGPPKHTESWCFYPRERGELVPRAGLWIQRVLS